MDIVTAYFEQVSETRGQVDWRVKCFQDGTQLATDIERDHFALAGKKVLDLACAWGGHALAFARFGAQVTAMDIKDHRFDRLRSLCAEANYPVRVMTADCQDVPLSEQFDVILALDLIEHIPDPTRLASEIMRLLAPGGVAVITTPPRLLSAIWGEPHYDGIKGIALLPLRMQRWAAETIFGRRYPYPIERQYLFASEVGRLFPARRCRAVPVSAKLPLSQIFWGRIEIT